MQGIKHKFIQDVEGKYECNYCEFKSTKKSTVSEHVSRIHPKDAGRQVNAFSCKHCGETFQNKSAVLHHVKTHHEITMVKCPFNACNYEAKNNTTLCTHYSRKHMPRLTISTEEVDMVKCTICQKTMKKTTAPYHVSKCYPASPFFTGSVMQDGSDEIILFKPAF
jgi:Fe-S-cluster-containing dehydrogenase component